MANKIVYLVKGITGEWDDKYRWVVKGFFDKTKAELLCRELNSIAQKADAGNFGDKWDERDTNLMYTTQEQVQIELQKIDPKASVTYPGTSYSVEELEVEVE